VQREGSACAARGLPLVQREGYRLCNERATACSATGLYASSARGLRLLSERADASSAKGLTLVQREGSHRTCSVRGGLVKTKGMGATYLL
jgi:hypothetical protein